MNWINDEVIGVGLAPDIQFYWQMILIRRTEQRILQLFQDNQVAGTTHTCLGQEANGVAVVNALDRGRDTVWSNHRCHGHFIAYCGQIAGLLAEIMGRDGGVCGGRGGSQHLCWERFHSSGIQGGLVPLALGTAFADRASEAISVVFLGDGTMGEGLVYEGLNLASLWSLPVLFVVEDNGIAQTTPRDLGVSGSIGERAKPFAIDSFSYQGTDVRALHAVAKRAVERVRRQRRPVWLHLETIRLGPHSKGDDTRPEAEVAALRSQDPIALQRARVDLPEDWERRADDLIERAIAEAQAQSQALGHPDGTGTCGS